MQANNICIYGYFITLLRQVGMESRMAEVLPELPVTPMALREINKLIPKKYVAIMPSINVTVWGRPDYAET